MAKVYRIWSEWDLGHTDLVFKSRADALKWLNSNVGLSDILSCEDYGATVETIFQQGLLGIEEVEVYRG